jgi:hypothetical protein
VPRIDHQYCTDRGKKECVDPEGNGVTMGEGAERGPGPPVGSNISSQSAARGWQDVHGGAERTARRARCDIKTLSCTEYVTLCTTVHCSALIIVIVNNVLF